MKPLPMIGCPKGCGECCSSMTPVTLYDTNRLISWLNDQLDAGRERWVRKLARSLRHAQEDPTLGCAFLDADMRCRIYDARPSICRMFGYGKHPLLQCSHVNAGTVTLPPCSEAEFKVESQRLDPGAGEDGIRNAISTTTLAKLIAADFRKAARAGRVL